MATETLPKQFQAEAAKYLTFSIGGECYGIPILKVREIIRILEITPVPQMPEYVKGVVNLRGKIIPVTDLRARFEMVPAGNTELNCIVVVQVTLRDKSLMMMGMIVDAVEEVVSIPADEIEPTPHFGGNFDPDYILGIAKADGQVKTLLDIEKVVIAVNQRDVASVGDTRYANTNH